MLCLLLVAVPVYGAATTLVELLGIRHIHALSHAASASADPMAGWSDLRRAGFQPAAARPAHRHSGSERHHHGQGDTTVVTLDGALQAGDAESGSTPAGSLAHVFALASVGSFDVPLRVDLTWLNAAPARASQWIADGPERPPKT